MSTFLAILLILTSIFLILLVLIQRGRGGGLAGAFGGMGGQSAFGAKAGDLFTRVTMGVAAFWIILCIVSLKVMNSKTSLFSSTLGGAANQDFLPPGGDDKTGGMGAGAATGKSDGKTDVGDKSSAGDKPAATDSGATSEKPASTPAATGGAATTGGEKSAEKSVPTK